MENKKYFDTGITYTEFAVIVESAIGYGEFDWALGFLERMREKISEPNKKVFIQLMQQNCIFKRDYSNARRHINSVELSDYLRYSESKLLECRILYIEGLAAELLLSVDKISKYLRSHKEIGGHYRKAYSNFLDVLKTLTRLREKIHHGKQVSFELSKLKKVLQDSGAPIYGQAWLIEKITEIEKAG